MALILLENTRSAFNVGSIFRIADAVQAEKILLVGYTPAPTDRMGRKNEKIAKTALGAEETVLWQQYTSAKAALQDHPNHSLTIVEQTPTATPYTEHTATHPMFVFGNETEGVLSSTQQLTTTHIALPMHGTKKSLNIAVVAGIVLYHHLTQKNTRNHNGRV